MNTRSPVTTPATPPNLALAFAVAERIHAIKWPQGAFHVLTLTGAGGSEWAATFDLIRGFDVDDWFDDHHRTRYPHSARSTDPAAAIMEAARKLIDDLKLEIEV